MSIRLGPTAAVIPVFITGHPVFIAGRTVVTKWGDYSTFDIPTVAEH